MFRAFLHLSEKECKEMTIGEYIDYSVMLDHVIKTWDNIGIHVS
jgi:hypothetical protein